MHLLDRALRLAILLACLVALQACATSGSLTVARDQFKHGSASEALETLSEANVSNRDRLLLYLDKGAIAQASGQYNVSITAFERAIELVEQLDYVSLRDQSAAVLTSDWATRYSGEYSERLWMHTFQMINYLMLDQAEGAAVEARRAVALLEEHDNTLSQDLFTRLLVAESFRSAGQRNSAMVEYRKLLADFDLPIPDAPSSEQGEVIFIIASGFITPKLPGDLFIDTEARISFPYYPDSFDTPPYIRVGTSSGVPDFEQVDTTLVSISRLALEERGKAIAARQALRVAAKYNIANAIDEENELAGGIARLLLFVIEQADTRSWETLPAHMSLLRVPVDAGQQSVTVSLDHASEFIGQLNYDRTFDIDLAPGQRLFKLIRLGINAE